MSAAPADHAPVYHAAAADALILAPLDALTAIYHRTSGITHLVVSPVPEILALLAERPMTRATLLDCLQAAFALADGDPALLGARLDELVAAGLVART